MVKFQARCSKCGTTFTADSAFCRVCGAKRATAAASRDQPRQSSPSLRQGLRRSTSPQSSRSKRTRPESAPSSVPGSSSFFVWSSSKLVGFGPTVAVTQVRCSNQLFPSPLFVRCLVRMSGTPRLFARCDSRAAARPSGSWKEACTGDS